MTASGKVYIIGAGPGDIELLTLKAVRALSQADVVLLDDLVNPEISQFFKPSAQLINVGKRGSCKSTPQDFIHDQMITLAKAGKCVARVKGGDPFIFGRGGEELLVLAAEHIDFEVVSGITSGIAAPAILNIPLTHRECAHSVTFVTGHSPDDGRINWKSLVEVGGTIVIYMGIKTIDTIIQLLTGAGLPPSTPAAVIQNATLSARQQHVVGSVDQLSAAVKQARIVSPAILVIGPVVGVADTIMRLRGQIQLESVQAISEAEPVLQEIL